MIKRHKQIQKRHKHRQKDRQMQAKINKRTLKETDGVTVTGIGMDRQTERQTSRQTDRQTFNQNRALFAISIFPSVGRREKMAVNSARSNQDIWPMSHSSDLIRNGKLSISVAQASNLGPPCLLPINWLFIHGAFCQGRIAIAINGP